MTYRYILLGTVAALGLTSQTFAQSAQQPADASAVEQIVVTGSRVASNGFSAPTPVTVLGAEKLQAQAPASIGEALVRLPAFRDTGGNEQAGRFAGGGRFSIDLRGLGASRTLLLIDGRRASGTTTLIPSNLVQRVEVVTGGASSAYGSDAVAGVVNFVLRDRIDGIEGKVQYGTSERGDGEEVSLSLATGFSMFDDRLRVIAGIDASEADPIGTIYSRDWSAKQEWQTSYSGARPADAPARIFATGVTYGAQTPGSLVLSGPLAGTMFGPGGVPDAFQRGQLIGNTMIGGSNPGMNPAGNFYMTSPIERYAPLARLTFDLNDKVQLFAEASYGHHRTASFITWQQNPSFVVSIDNPFIPAQTRAEMVRRGLTSLTLGRVNVDMGGGRFHIDKYDVQRYVAGAKGRAFDALDWDFYYQKSRETSSTKTPTDVLPANVLAAFYAVTGPNGQAVCGPLASNPNLTATQRAQVTPGCVPYNVFGSGSRSEAALDYVLDTSYNRSFNTQQVTAFNLRAKPFSTWAGPVAIAVGAEARWDKVDVITDPLSELSLHSLINQKAYSGKANVKEAYAEVLVPLAADTAWAKSLDLNMAGRVTDYSTSGRVSTWKVGASYAAPFGLRLRGTRSVDIRAPSMGELFSAGNFGAIISSAQNPLNGAFGNVFQQTGGNPNLKPERANTLTFGVVYQPEWMPGLGMSVDTYDIKLKDVITSPGAANILNLCRSGDQRYCALIVQDSTPFGIAYVLNRPSNLSERYAKGADFEISYRMPVSRLMADAGGDLIFRALATHVDHFRTNDNGVVIERAGSGTGGMPRWTYNVDVTYTGDRLTTNLNVRGFNQFKWDSTALGPEDAGYTPASPVSVNKNRFPALAYANLSVNYDLIRTSDRNIEVFGTINNLFDRDPPTFALIGFPNGGNPYSIIGRYYRTGVRFKY